MPQPKLLEMGEPSELELLRRRIEELEDELRLERLKVEEVRQRSVSSGRALTRLRSQLQPWYSALRMVFGELDDAGTETMEQVSASTGLSAKWEMMKAKLGGRQAEFIDLLKHGEMTAAQLRAAAHCDIRTAYSVIEKMKNAGLLNKNGGKFSLKEL